VRLGAATKVNLVAGAGFTVTGWLVAKVSDPAVALSAFGCNELAVVLTDASS